MDMKRHLCAILAADIVGYSRLMEADEAGTLARQKRHFSETIEPAIDRNNGRVVKLMGDGVLLEFESVVDAVMCAVEIQRSMFDREAKISADRRILYRVGINLGDVFSEDGDIFGDAVNITARLEQMADPGGICISGTAYDHLKSNVPVGYEYLGEVSIKNIAQKVRVYRLLLNETISPAVPPKPPQIASRGRMLAASAVALLIVLGGVAWWIQEGKAPGTSAPELAGSDEQPDDTAVPAMRSVSGLPSIAVLPFDNLSGNEDQDYFSDGMTEDLITDLSQVSGLFVLARNTTFTYKGRAVNVQQIGRELGVSYVLEGSVRRAGDRVRINAQLIDTETGGHVWADRYDRDLTDIFALQDDVVQRIVAALQVSLKGDEQERLSRTAKVDPEAYDALLRGLELLRRFTRETNIEARRYFERAIAIDPGFARAHADLALTYGLEAEQLWSDDPITSARRGLEIGLEALRLDSDNALSYFALSVVYRGLQEVENSVAAAQRVVELDPNYADGYATLSISLSYTGRPKEGLTAIRRATELNPTQPFFYVWAEGLAYYVMGDYLQALRLFEKVVERNPHFPAAHKMLVTTYMDLGRTDDAEWAAYELMTTAPAFSLALVDSTVSFTDPEQRLRYLENLRAAGIK